MHAPCRMQPMAHTQHSQPYLRVSSPVCHRHRRSQHPLLFKYHMVASRPGKATINILCPPAGQDRSYRHKGARRQCPCPAWNRCSDLAGSVAGTSGRSPAGSLLASPSTTGTGRAPAPSKGGLTSSQAAAQLALCNGSSNHVNGLVPVRTGLAWATLGCVLAPVCMYILPKDIWRRPQVPCFVGLTYGSHETS